MPSQPQEFWNMRAPSYDQTSGKTYAETYDQTAERSLKYLKPSDRVLEFACGTGLITLRLAPHVAHIRGIDISPGMADIAREKARGLPNVEITNTDLFDPCLEPGSFDAVCAYNVLLYLPDLPAALARIRELLKPGGVFLSATDCLGARPLGDGTEKAGEEPYREDALNGLLHPAGAGAEDRPERLCRFGAGEPVSQSPQPVCGRPGQIVISSLCSPVSPSSGTPPSVGFPSRTAE